MQEEILNKLGHNISRTQLTIQNSQSYQMIGLLGMISAASLFKFGGKQQIYKKLTTPIAAILFPSSCYLFGYNTVVKKKSNRKLEKFMELYNNVKDAEIVEKKEGKKLLELIKSIEFSK